MKLSDYINYYIGCKMIRSSHWQPQNEPYILDYKNIAEAIEFDDMLVLRRLEDMSEEEAKYLETDLFHIRHYCDRENFTLNLTPSQFHYLLKRGFDLFGLIPPGLAIDAKTITP